MIYSRIQVEEQGKIYRLVWIQKLVFKAEALDFIEIKGDFFGEYLIDRNSSDRFVRSIVHLVKGESSFTCVHNKLRRL